MEAQIDSVLDQKGDIIDTGITEAPLAVEVKEFRTLYRGGKAEIYVYLKKKASEPQFQNITEKRLKDIKPEGAVDLTDLTQAYNYRLWKEVVEPAYNVWMEGNSPAAEGETPLGAWHHLTHEACDYLRSLGYKSVESIKSMPEDVAAEIPIPDGPGLPALAAEYLASKDEGAAIAALQPEIDKLREELAESNRQREKLAKRVKEIDGEDSSKGARFEGMEVVVDGIRYASRRKADSAWGFKEGTIGGHIKDGTLDAFIAAEKGRRTESGHSWPGRDEEPEETAEAS